MVRSNLEFKIGAEDDSLSEKSSTTIHNVSNILKFDAETFIFNNSKL